MITLRASEDRGKANLGWLDSKHTFSFASYYDPEFLGVSDLLVINDDRVKPGMGFATHGHRDMEIISYVIEGSIEHQDTMGFKEILRAGEIQVMSAGTGVRHSEYNAERAGDLHFLQIWIKPGEKALKPSYAQKDFADVSGIVPVVTPDGRDGSLLIHQDASIHKIKLEPQQTSFAADAKRTYYLHLIAGQLELNGTRLNAGDGATIRGENLLALDIQEAAEGLLIELQ